MPALEEIEKCARSSKNSDLQGTFCQDLLTQCFCDQQIVLQKRGKFSCFGGAKEDPIIVTEPVPEGFELNSKNELSHETYKKYVSELKLWGDEARPLDQNPLLKPITESQQTLIEKLKSVDPSVKSQGFTSSDQWTKRIWTGALQMRDWIRSQKGDIRIETVMDIMGQYRHFMKVEEIMRENKAKLGKGEITQLPDPKQVAKDAKDFGGYIENGFVARTPIGKEKYDLLDVFPDIYNVEDFRMLIRGNLDSAGRALSPDLPVEFPVLSQPDFRMPTRLGKFENNEGMVAIIKIDGEAVHFIQYQDKVFDGAPKDVNWVVGSYGRYEKIRDQMASVFNSIVREAKAKKYDQANYNAMVGTQHWLISNACPFYRGTAAVADLMTATSYLLRDLQWQGWKPKVSADVSALCSPSLRYYQSEFGNLQEMPKKLKQL